jgi:hypothetical protein
MTVIREKMSVEIFLSLVFINRSIELVELHKENKSVVMITNRIFKKKQPRSLFFLLKKNMTNLLFVVS